MNYESFLKTRVIEPAKVTDGEIAEHLRVADHDINLAQNVAGLDLDWAFTIAYNGILQSALAFMYFKGYRPRGEAKHYNTFRFLKAALPDQFQKEISKLQKLRRRRNLAVYQARGVVSEKEAKNIVKFAGIFHKEIIGLMPDKIVNLIEKE